MLFVLVTLLSSASLAEPEMAGIAPRCDGKFELCRYVDIQSGDEVIPARFERAMPFSEGLAAVRIEGRFGYVDRRGEIVIEPRFDLAGDFYQGLAEVLVGDRTGIVNRAGEIVIPPMFRRAVPLTKDVVIAVEGRWTSGYYQGFEKLPGLKDGVHELENAGLYHVGGYWVRRPDLKRISLFDRDGRGLVWATERGQSADLIGLLASDGTWIADPQYEYAGLLSDERAVVRKRVGTALLSGAVDPTGRLVIPLRPWALFGWRNGWGRAKESYQGGKEGLVDKNGHLIGGRYFDKVESWEEGDIATVLIGDRFMGLDRAGNIVPHPRNGRLYASCPTGVRIVEMDGKAQITDAGGQQTAPYLFERLLQRPICDKPFPVQLGGKWGFVGLDGRLLFDPPIFDDLHGFEGDYAVVKQGQKWGIIDASGRFVLALKLDGIRERRAGLFRVAMEGRDLWITAAGEERPEPAIQHAPAPAILDCGHGLRLAESAGKWGIVDSDGRTMIEPRYRAVACFKNGVAWAPIDSRRQWCAIGPDGALREKPACQTAHYPYIQTHSIPETFHEDPFENSVLWSRAYLEFGLGQRDVPPRMIPDGPRGGVSSSIIR
jgi:hypothetical protein